MKNANPEDVQVEHEHEYARGTSSKVPSTLAYEKENHNHPDFESQDEIKCGFEVDGSMTSMSFFKMCVDLEESNSHFDDCIFEDPVSKLLVPTVHDVDGYSALVDYMEWFFRLQISRTERTQGPDYLDKRSLLIVLTHPAACSDSGKSRLVAAAKEAGWTSRPGTSMKICSEAEAAALAEFVARRKRKDFEAWEQEFRV